MSQKKSGDKVTWFIVALLLVASILMGYQEVMDRELLPRGSPAPDFSVRTPSGATVRLSQLKGKVVLVDFWATWCPPCVEEMPWLVETAKRYEAQGVVLVALSNDDVGEQAEAVEAFTQRLPQLRPHVAYGTPEVGASYLVHSLPTLYVIDRQGLIAETHVGQASQGQLHRWVEAALAR